MYYVKLVLFLDKESLVFDIDDHYIQLFSKINDDQSYECMLIHLHQL